MPNDNGIYDFFKLCIAFMIILIGVVIFCLFKSCNKNNIVKTKTKPNINWELKANGQKVDTIWIYKFEK